VLVIRGCVSSSQTDSRCHLCFWLTTVLKTPFPLKAQSSWSKKVYICSPFCFHIPVNGCFSCPIAMNLNSRAVWNDNELWGFSFSFLRPVLPRRGGAVSRGFCVQDLADLQEGVPSAGRLHLDHRLRLGLHAAQWADAAGSRAPGPSDAQRFVSQLQTLVLPQEM